MRMETGRGTKGKLVLRKESFGGIFVDTMNGKKRILRPEEYENKKIALEQRRMNGEHVLLFDARERGYELLQNALSSPFDIYLELTKRCNNKCVQCYIDANSSRWSNKDELSFDEVKQVIKDFSMAGGFYVRMTGGEPTVREDFFDLVDIIHEEGLIIGLNTHGLYGADKLEKIISTGIKEMRVSLDGPTEDDNDGIRGEGTYRKIIDTFGRVAEYNRNSEEPIDLVMNFVLMKSNMQHIEKMVELSQRYRSKLSLGPLRINGRADVKEMLTPEDNVRVAYLVQKIREREGLPGNAIKMCYDIFYQPASPAPHESFKPYPFDNSKCALGAKGVSVDAYGRICPCGFLTGTEKWTGEDVRSKDWLDLWHNSDVLKEARMVSRPGCDGCGHYLTTCSGGCPATAYAMNGDLNSVDPYCVRNVDVETALSDPKFRKMIAR
jgi:radical SAM protein with 4Fe4S-binding SPASM domain